MDPTASATRIDRLSVAFVVVIHVLACAAFLPWVFSWTGVAVCLAGFYVFGTLGINFCYHRLLSHRSFKCSPWLEHATAILGVCCLQKSPGQFAALHRKHHQHSDTDHDPHSPLVNFFWGHMGWVFEQRPREEMLRTSVQYAKDLYRQPFYQRLEKNLLWLRIYVLHALAFFVVGCVAGLIVNRGALMPALQLGVSVFIWGVCVRTVCVWHITWSVNSFAHIWGYRSYATGEDSRNNVVVALLSNGEGWHNNHHADQRSAAHGHRWWELDVTYVTIAAFERVGLVWDVIQRQPHLQETVADETAARALAEEQVDAADIDEPRRAIAKRRTSRKGAPKTERAA